MAQVSGTFTATGVSDSLTGRQIVAIQATFSGAATVEIQWNLGTGWVAIQDGAFTETFSKVFEAPSIPIRLNCSAHTGDVAYVMSGQG